MKENNEILLETLEVVDNIDDNSFMKGALVGGAAVIAGSLAYKYAIRPIIGKIRSKFAKKEVIEAEYEYEE